jgi:hypothetical protein
MRPLFFLSKECEEDYVWVLTKKLLLLVFPQRLSSTIKNILARYRHLFVESKDNEGMKWASFMNQWETVVHSPSNDTSGVIPRISRTSTRNCNVVGIV